MLTMEEAMRQTGKLPFAAGNIVKGTIIEVRPKEVLVDIGYKSEGVISGNEFEDIKTVKVGDQIDVLIEKLEDKEGMVVLSKEKAEFKQNWERILTICNEGGTIAGKVKAIVKGGLLVNIGVEAFLPASQIDILAPKNLAQYVGNTYDFKVVKINQERQNIVLSRRELIEQERTERRQKLLTEMTPGDIRKGTVKNITDFGAFIDLNGIDGLLHITDMSWGRIGHPSEILKVGQDIDVVVLDINREKERVSLGLKQKLANPWDTIEQKYPVGAKVKGRVVNLVPYGAFVELEPGVEGLVHVTELSWTKRIAKPSDVLKPDQEIEAVVLGINREEQKISLGLRQLEANPWDKAHGEIPARHQRQRQDSQPHQLRRLHRAGRRPGRHDPRLRHVLDPQDQSPLRSPQEGRRSRSRRAGSGQGQPAHRRRHEAAHARSVGRHRPALQGRRPRHRQGHQAGQLRRVHRLAARD